MKVLGLDPGDTTGVAQIEIINKRITPVDAANIPYSLKVIQDLIDWADVVVCENFRVRPKNAKAGHFNYSEMPTTKLIGKIELLCEQTQTEFVLQEPAVKPVGYGFANLKYSNKKHGVHWQDALAHAVYYSVTRQGAVPVRAN